MKFGLESRVLYLGGDRMHGQIIDRLADHGERGENEECAQPHAGSVGGNSDFEDVEDVDGNDEDGDCERKKEISEFWLW